MAKVDITGLLTGLAGTPDLEREGIKRASAIQGQGVGSNLARSLALRAPQREQMMRQGAGGLFGVDTRTAGQQVQEQLGQLDTSTPEGQKQAVQLIAQVDPARALALKTRFAEENKALQTATAAALVEEKRYQQRYALDQREVEVKEAKTALELVQTNSANSQAAVIADLLPEGNPLIPIIRAGNVKAMEAGLKLIESPNGSIVRTIKQIDSGTGIENHVGLDSQGKVVAQLGIASMPTYTTVKNPNGTTTVTNDRTGSETTSETVETEFEAVQKRTILESKLGSINNVLLSIGTARDLVDEGAAGWEYDLVKHLPVVSDAKQLSAVVTQLNSTLAFDRLDQMRKESITGGALGSIAVAELMLLQGALQALDPSAGAEFFNKQLDIVERHYKNYALTLNGKLPVADYNSSIMPNHTQEKDGTVFYKDPITNKVSQLGKTSLYPEKKGNTE